MFPFTWFFGLARRFFVRFKKNEKRSLPRFRIHQNQLNQYRLPLKTSRRRLIPRVVAIKLCVNDRGHGTRRNRHTMLLGRFSFDSLKIPPVLWITVLHPQLPDIRQIRDLFTVGCLIILCEVLTVFVLKIPFEVVFVNRGFTRQLSMVAVLEWSSSASSGAPRNLWWNHRIKDKFWRSRKTLISYRIPETASRGAFLSVGCRSDRDGTSLSGSTSVEPGQG